MTRKYISFAVAVFLGLTTLGLGQLAIANPNTYLETNQKYAEAFGNPNFIQDPSAMIGKLNAGGALKL